jgi:putative transposase
MTKHTTVLAGLLSHLSTFDFKNAVEAHKTDKGIRNLSTWDFFKIMVYGLLSRCFSVREIGDSTAANAKSLYHAGLKPAKRSTLCDAMEKRSHKVFQTVFHGAAEQARQLAGRMQKKFKDPLRIIDATILPLCLAKCPWAAFRQAKGAAKIHLKLDGESLLPLDACLTNGKVHDEKRMLWLCQESGVIYVMDRGYIDYKSLYCIELNGSIFVTRMKSNGTYKRVKVLKHEDNANIISDVLIELTGNVTKKYYPKQLRKIKYRDPETDRIYEFITNDLKREAQEVADIYKERWQIELFFKWIKQNLNIKTFWGTSENAVYTQIWIALIVSVLLWICKTVDGITDTMSQVLHKMKTTLLSRQSILELCSNKPPPGKPPSLQLVLEGFYD